MLKLSDGITVSVVGEYVPGEFPKTCSCCGAVYRTVEEWEKLPQVAEGMSAWDGYFFDYRDCVCAANLQLFKAFTEQEFKIVAPLLEQEFAA